MKSKQNSKSQKHPITKSSLLVTQQSPSIRSTDQKCTRINLSSRDLTSVSGIGQYRELKYVDLSNNNISQYSSLRDLRQCQKLEKINVQNNPICFRPNFIYGIMDVLDRNVCINGCQAEVDWSVLKAWQIENGYKIAVFLLQCCVIFDSILKKTKTQNIKQIKSQLQPLKHSLQLDPTIPSSQSRTILQINQAIHKHLPLQQIELPQFTEQQMQEIKDYFIQKLIQNNDNKKQNNKFMYKILNNIEVADDQEEKQLIQQVQVTKIIVKQYVEREFQGFWGCGNGVNGVNGRRGGEDGMRMGSVKHFTSADTALDTYDTAVRSNTCVYKYGLHFCMDLDYLQAAVRVLLNQIDRLEQIIDQQLKIEKKDEKQSHKTIKFSLEQKHSSQQILKTSLDEKQVDKLNSPIHVYNNSMILCNLLKVLQTPIKRIIFRKIKNSKNKQLITNMMASLQCSLQNSFFNLMRLSFYNLKQRYQYESKIVAKFNQSKLTKIFKFWKSMKKRKQKLLKNIVKRKIKGDTFMLAVMITKWKINSRADRIKRMASAAILGTRINSMPKSKKGVQLAYKRTIANRQIKLL